MAMSNKLRRYLKQHDVSCKLIHHPHSEFSMETAGKATVDSIGFVVRMRTQYSAG